MELLHVYIIYAEGFNIIIYNWGQKMKSKTKNILSEDQISRLVKVNFGEKTVMGDIEELKGGAFNSAYSIERVNEKDKIVLKVSVAPDTTVLSYEKDIMKREVEVYRLIKKHTNIPIPEILCHDFSKKHIDSDYFFMTYVEGVTMNSIQKKISSENLDRIKEVLGGYFAQLHQIKGLYFGYMTDDVSCQFDSWKEAYLHMVQMILDDGKLHGVRLPYDRINKVLSEKSKYLDIIQEPCLVDFDLWSGNIFLKKRVNEYSVEAIVDLERAFWGDPYADFQAAVMLLDDIRNEPVLWRSYNNLLKDNKDISKDDVVRMTMYKMYLYIIMTVETYRYGTIYGMIQKLYSKSILKKCLTELESF